MIVSGSTRNICPQCGATVMEDARFCGMCGGAILRPAERDPYVGEVVAGRYAIQKRIAVGGMGQVYVAKHETLDQLVAVKLLHRRYASDEKVVARFFREARSYCRVKHAHAVGLLDFGRLNDGTLYIVTEYVDGLSLAALVSREGPLAPARVVRMGRQLAEVLAAAHDEQIIHRDLKPDNVMVTEGPGGRYTVKVLDFGIAKILDESEQRLTNTGSVFGTPEYMSPEQAQGREVDYSTDLYSLGAVLFHMLTGAPPFQSERRTDILQRHITEPPPIDRLRKNKELPAALVSLVEDLLEKMPDRRPAGMLDVLGRLEALESTVPEPARTRSKGPERPLPTAPTLESPASASASATDQPDPASASEDASASGADDRSSGKAEAVGEAGLAEALTSSEQDSISPADESFIIDLDRSSSPSDDAFVWGDEDGVDSDDPFHRPLDVGPGDVPVSALRGSHHPLPWIVAAVLLVGGGIGAYVAFTAEADGGRSTATSADVGDPDAPGSSDALATRPGTGSAEAPGTGAATAPDDPQTGGSSSELGLSAPATEPATGTPAPPSEVPAAVKDLVSASREAGVAAALLRSADVTDAAEHWDRAQAFLTGAERGDVAPAVAAELARAQELIAGAEDLLRRNRCSGADVLIVEMREISPALRRRYLRPLHRCNQRREEASGRPPRTLE